jgi:GNAT superfamily N-acetyltransferase
VIEPIGPSHDLAHFNCGKPALNDWLIRRALFNHREGFTSVQVAHVEKQVIGYYGLSPTSVLPKVFPRSIRTGQPPNLIPCLLLGRLAIDLKFIGQGLGSTLLLHALKAAVSASAFVGGRAVIVHALDDDALSYWRGRGFTSTADDSHTLFMSMVAVKATILHFSQPDDQETQLS